MLMAEKKKKTKNKSFSKNTSKKKNFYKKSSKKEKTLSTKRGDKGSLEKRKIKALPAKRDKKVLPAIRAEKASPAIRERKAPKKISKSFLILWGTILGIVIVLAGISIYIVETYSIRNIYVEGNTYYDDSEIIDMVMTDSLSYNSLYLSMKYTDKSIENIPFVEKMSVNIVSPDTVKIVVYEKALAGYIEYLGRYIYFDSDGTAVESSTEQINDVPQVMGLDCSYVVMSKKLPVDNEDIFSEILDITQLLSKYELKANKIFFDSKYNIYLYFDDVEVDIGTGDNLDEKIIQLQYILPSLSGKKGILNLSEYSEETTNVTFEENSDS